MTQRSFASDNAAGVHPEVMAAIQQVNQGHAVAYGDDDTTKRACRLLQDSFGAEEALLVFGGTGANVVGLGTVSQPYHSILCAATGHINVDECGAPERHLGSKVIGVPTVDGKLRPDTLTPYLKGFGVEHHSQPGVISVSQPTELGTVYRIGELAELADLAHRHDMAFHVDGARLVNAAAFLGCSLSAISSEVGVDVLSLGGAKAGLLAGEAVLFFGRRPAARARYYRKQAMQLPSKMRFLAVQFEALYRDDLWLRTASHANEMARSLTELVSGVPGVTITQPVESNAVFARIPPAALKPIRQQAFFYTWDEPSSEVRWMTAWDTTEEDVATFAGVIAEECARVT